MKALPGESPSRVDVARRWLTGTLPGRTLLAGACIKLITTAAGTALDPRPGWLAVLDAIGGGCVVFGGLVIAYRAYIGSKRRLLWRVRRKLTLSYIFIGFVPALLIIAFFLLCGLLMFFNVSSYLVQNRIGALVGQTRFLAQTAAIELQRLPASAGVADAIERRQVGASSRYSGASYAVLPVQRNCPSSAPRSGRGVAVDTPVLVGPWAHVAPPLTVPQWVSCAGHAGIVAYRELAETPQGSVVPRMRFGVRAIALPDVSSPRYAVVVDVPVTREIAHYIRDETGIEIGRVDVISGGDLGPQAMEGRRVSAEPDDPADGGLQSSGAGRSQSWVASWSWVAFLDFVDWDTGQMGRITLRIDTRIAELYDRISATQAIGTVTLGQFLIALVAFVGIMFLVIQFMAFLMGLSLARSITGAVHELFTGTQRVQQGDFNHKIPIRSHDQLGELAMSFNEMTGSIEELLRQKAEKERLEQELKIARSIQMSLLPQGRMRMPGLALSAHCEPAREVGGDYYDFLPLGADRLGILIADVSGKGTSAALYMAELKGLMLSLTQLHTSPRLLLIDANRIISQHLDSRSFITMTYAVVDLKQRTLTYARAGHCPLIYCPAGDGAGPAGVRILAPDGLVLGLNIDNGEMFERLLQEETLPLGAGDLFVLFTDGISEAMNLADECFGESRLGELVGELAHLPFEELRERILREIRAFVGAASQHDDMTMILLKVEEAGVPAVS